MKQTYSYLDGSLIGLLIIFVFALISIMFLLAQKPVISPLQDTIISPLLEPTTTPIPTPTPLLEPTTYTGFASYYSVDGCIGCNENRIMANGEKLDDTKLTVAFNRAPLNSYVLIQNVGTGAVVTAKVTDTGGYERHGKIIDLSVATRDALGCDDVCMVQVIL